ncbi:MAG: M48 family metallopeptidase [Gemmatimonadales bacterium]|nr:M48 family metallopeptidase [Gemmatimonadales bacterium]
MTSLPSHRPRVAFPEIAGVSWEHPADRAALQTMRSVPGFDEAVRKIVAILGGERGIRLLFQGNSVRAGPEQFPLAHSLLVEVATTFDWKVPELYVSQTPIFNAGAYGVDDPFIVLHSAAIELLDEEELRVLISHEMGHVVSGHALYRTIAEILLNVSLAALPLLAGIALLPIRLAILEWSRKAELSADRAGLLGSQNVIASQQLFMKMAGAYRGALESGQMKLDPFIAQASEYVATNEGLDIVYKILNTLALTHPMNTVRAAELQKWIQSGDYEAILRGQYTRRGAEAKERPLKEEFRAAKDHYKDEAKETFGKVADAAKKAAATARDAFRKAQNS